MDGRSDVPPTPPYLRDPSLAGAAANPSAGFATSTGAAAPPVGLARGLFMAPRANSVDGVARAAAKRPAASAAAQNGKKGEPAAKRVRKAAAAAPPIQAPPPPFQAPPQPEAHLPPPPLPFQAPTQPEAELPPDAPMVFDQMHTSLNDDAYLSTMGVGSNTSQWSQNNEIHDEDHEYEDMDEDGEGLMEAPKGRAGNYSTKEDVLLCNAWLNVSLDASVATAQTYNTYWDRMKVYFDARNKSGVERSNRSLRSRLSLINSDCQKWSACLTAVDSINPSGTNDVDRLNIAQGLFRGEDKKGKNGKAKRGRPFVMSHCYDVLKDEEKWKKREGLLDVPSYPNIEQLVTNAGDDDEEGSSDGTKKRSPTPNSVAYTKPKRPTGAKQAKESKKKGGDDDLKNAMDEMVKARKQQAEDRRAARTQEAAIEARKVAAEERRVALEEKKLQMDEQARVMEYEKYLFFMDTSHFDERQKEFFNICRDQHMVQKKMMGMGGMGGVGATMGGMGGMGSFGGMGGTMGGFGSICTNMGGVGGMSFGSLMGGYGGMGGMGGMSAPPVGMGGYGGMGNMGGPSAPPVGMGVSMGGGNASGMPHVPSDGAFEGSGNTVQVENEAVEEDAGEDAANDGKSDEEKENGEEEDDA